MAKYKCKKSKDEILKIIVEHTKKINEEYTVILGNDSTESEKYVGHGKVDAMFNLCKELVIFEEEK